MHYPWWYVPTMTAPMLIAAIATLHVLIAHYAVGGGLFLAVETSYAHRTNNFAYLAYLRRHARFFVLLTVVLGAVTGVGIWWTIGLASPLATEMLIRTFVFGWAIEYVFFVIELVAAFLFLYYWGRMPVRSHMAMGWIYAVAAWVSLVLITGITAFMLHSGGLFGNWRETGNFWDAFFNRQFIPQTIYRTGAAILLSALYVYLHASITLGDEALRQLLQRRSARPALVGSALALIGVLLWYVNLPPSAALALASAGALNVFLGISIAATGGVAFLVWLGPLRNPHWMSPGFATAMFLVGFSAFGGAEFIREAVRKPFIVDQIILGNQVYMHQIADAREKGYLESGLWTRAYVERRFPQVREGDTIDETRFADLTPEQRLELGRVIFMYHCNDCHAEAVGYSAVGPLLTGRSRDSVLHSVERLHESRFVMPPWCGTPEEADVLTDYLMTLQPRWASPFSSSPD